jgi:hypothetical protein
MTVSVDKARDFVYRHGTLFERALFAWLFDKGDLERLQQVILCYKNRDNGFGHGFEHDILSPDSNPLALEYLLTVMKYVDMPISSILDGTSEWVEAQMDSEGFLQNPSNIRNYPIAPWWQDDGGQNLPDSIIANLIHFDKATPSLINKGKAWVRENLTPDKIRSNEWLFMAYHAIDFFFVVSEDPEFEPHREATIENVLLLAENAPKRQYYSLLPFIVPNSPIAEALPKQLIDKYLTYLEQAQQDDGSWLDQHDLPHWYPAITINVLLGLKRYNRV